MQKFYYFILIFFGVLTALASIPNLALLITIFTFGLGFGPLIFAVNFFVVLLCFFPFSVLPRFIALPLTISLLAACIFVPSVYSDQAERNIMQAEQADAVQNRAVFTNSNAIGLEIIRPDQASPNLKTRVVSDELCDAFCQRLLHGGQVDWIRIVTEGTKRNPLASVSMVKRGDAD